MYTILNIWRTYITNIRFKKFWLKICNFSTNRFVVKEELLDYFRQNYHKIKQKVRIYGLFMYSCVVLWLILAHDCGSVQPRDAYFITYIAYGCVERFIFSAKTLRLICERCAHMAPLMSRLVFALCLSLTDTTDQWLTTLSISSQAYDLMWYNYYIRRFIKPIAKNPPVRGDMQINI